MPNPILYFYLSQQQFEPKRRYKLLSNPSSFVRDIRWLDACQLDKTIRYPTVRIVIIHIVYLLDKMSLVNIWKRLVSFVISYSLLFCSTTALQLLNKPILVLHNFRESYSDLNIFGSSSTISLSQRSIESQWTTLNVLDSYQKEVFTGNNLIIQLGAATIKSAYQVLSHSYHSFPI